MDKITQQVSRARKRLNFEKFLHITSWTVFAGLLLAAAIFGGRVLWGASGTDEMGLFAAGGAGAGLLLGLVITYLRRRESLDAALEIDRRFNLKERVSTSLSLPDEELDSEVGQALVADAIRRVERIEVADEFKIKTGPQIALPLVAALVFACTIFLPTPTERKAEAAAKEKALQEQIRKPAEELKKKIEKRKKEVAEKGLTDASELLKKISNDLDKVASSDVKKKDALMKLNDIAKEISERRKQLGGADSMKKQLQGLKNMKPGPADKMQQAMKKGDFEAAMDAMQDLKDKIADGDMSEEEKQKLADQLKQMKDKMDEMAAERESKKQELQQQIQQRRDAGDTAGAERLQQQLDQLNEQQEAMDQMQSLADKLGQAADNLQAGESDLAMENLDDLLDQLQSMQQQLDELQELDSLMDELGEAKNGMSGQYGMGRMGNGNGNGLGEGQGEGERPIEETDTGTFNSKVAGNIQKGAAVRTGVADGPNRKGVSRESIKEEIQMSISQRAEAIQDQKRLPKDQRDHLREYFRNFTDNN